MSDLIRNKKASDHKKKSEDKSKFHDKCHEICHGRCGTDCTSSSSRSHCRCNGVFAPICEPEVCDIPRLPRKHHLVVGEGMISREEPDLEEMIVYEEVQEPPKKRWYYTGEVSGKGHHYIVEQPHKEMPHWEMPEEKKYWFKICIYREFTAIKGKFILMTESGERIVKSAQLESYHAPEDDNMVAIFHVMLEDGTSREVTVYAKKETCKSAAALYAYSAPLFEEEIIAGSELICGELNIYHDVAMHEH